MQYCWNITYKEGEVTAKKGSELDFQIGSHVQALSCFLKSLKILKGHIEILKYMRSQVESVRLSFLAYESIGKR